MTVVKSQDILKIKTNKGLYILFIFLDNNFIYLIPYQYKVNLYALRVL